MIKSKEVAAKATYMLDYIDREFPELSDNDKIAILRSAAMCIEFNMAATMMAATAKKLLK